MSESLPALVDRASQALAGARTAAEILDARDLATIAYDAAKRAARMQRAKHAHDEVLDAVRRAGADALIIESQAKARLADEYDAAQARGEMVGPHDGAQKRVPGGDPIGTLTEVGLTKQRLHSGRKRGRPTTPDKLPESGHLIPPRYDEARAEETGEPQKTIRNRVARGRKLLNVEPDKAAARAAAREVRAAERRAAKRLVGERFNREKRALVSLQELANDIGRADVAATVKAMNYDEWQAMGGNLVVVGNFLDELRAEMARRTPPAPEDEDEDEDGTEDGEAAAEEVSG